MGSWVRGRTIPLTIPMILSVLYDNLTLRQNPRACCIFVELTVDTTWLHITYQLSYHPACTFHYGSTHHSSTKSANMWHPCPSDIIVWEKYPNFFRFCLFFNFAKELIFTIILVEFQSPTLQILPLVPLICLELFCNNWIFFPIFTSIISSTS